MAVENQAAGQITRKTYKRTRFSVMASIKLHMEPISNTFKKILHNALK
jgi:hypothetical protein